MAQLFNFEKNGTPIESLTLTSADFDANGLWSSDEKLVGNFSACQAFVVYEALDPDFQTPNGNQVVDFDIFARMETEVGPGKWHPIVSQIEPFDSDFADAKTRILIADPGAFVPNPESEIFDGFDTSKVQRQIQIGGKIRMCILKRPTNISGALPFQSVTISMDGQFY